MPGCSSIEGLQLWVSVFLCALTQSVLQHPAWWGWRLSYLEQRPPYPPRHVPLLSSAGHRTCSSQCSGRDKSDSYCYTHVDNIFWKYKGFLVKNAVIMRKWCKSFKTTRDLHAHNGLKTNKWLPRPDVASKMQLESVNRSTNYAQRNSCLRMNSSADKSMKTWHRAHLKRDTYKVHGGAFQPAAHPGWVELVLAPCYRKWCHCGGLEKQKSEKNNYKEHSTSECYKNRQDGRRREPLLQRMFSLT